MYFNNKKNIKISEMTSTIYSAAENENKLLFKSNHMNKLNEGKRFIDLLII